MIGELLSEVGGLVGHGLVLAWFELQCICASLSLFRQFFTISRTREHFCILFIPLHIVVLEIQFFVERDDGRSSIVFGSVHSLMFIA